MANKSKKPKKEETRWEVIENPTAKQVIAAVKKAKAAGGQAKPAPDRPICGATTKSGTPCQCRVIMANGRCRVHGGASTGRPLVHGRYAKVARGKLAMHLENAETSDYNPVDMAAEIQLSQAILEILVERVDNGSGAIDPMVAEAVLNVADSVSKMQARMIKARNETALTAVEVKLLLTGMQALIDEFIPDPARRRLFFSRLSELVPLRARE